MPKARQYSSSKSSVKRSRILSALYFSARSKGCISPSVSNIHGPPSFIAIIDRSIFRTSISSGAKNWREIGRLNSSLQFHASKSTLDLREVAQTPEKRKERLLLLLLLLP